VRTYRPFAALTAATLAATLSASCSGCRGNQTTSDEAGGEGASVSVEIARVQTLRAAVAGPGLIAPSATGDWTIHAAETGRIVALTKQEGDPVEDNEVLVRFEYATTAATMTLENDLAAATHRFATATAEVRKITPLAERGYASRAELDTAKAAASSAEMDIARIKRMIDAANSENERAVIRARFAGKVAKVFHKEGDLVNGSALDPVMRVIDPTKVEVLMSVQVQELGQVQVGQQATVMTAEGGAQPATVIERPLPTDPRAPTVDIRLALTNPATTPAIDSPVSVEILLAERPNVIAMPTAAVIHDGPKAYVMLVGDDSRALRREVTIGVSARDRVEIAAGVAAGERVIVKDAGAVEVGAVVVPDK
jgi:RND family efflux transporter MFP subunit